MLPIGGWYYTGSTTTLGFCYDHAAGFDYTTDLLTYVMYFDHIPIAQENTVIKYEASWGGVYRVYRVYKFKLK